MYWGYALHSAPVPYQHCVYCLSIIRPCLLLQPAFAIAGYYRLHSCTIDTAPSLAALPQQGVYLGV